jgi:hypothetical protein
MCPAPDWEFDPTAYSGSMNFTLKLDIEGTLSTDEEDILAAFIDGELRGLAKVQLLPTLPPLGTQYRVFLTVFGDPEDDGKPISLDIWDASSCLRYVDLIESFDFEIDNVIGTVGGPTVLHTNNLIRRDIALNPGWNWISFDLLFPIRRWTRRWCRWIILKTTCSRARVRSPNTSAATGWARCPRWITRTCSSTAPTRKTRSA